MRDDHYDEDGEPYVVIEKHSSGMGSFFLGLAIGAGLALLFAPQSGEETRQTIARGARRVRRAATDAVEGVTDKVTDSFESARQKVEDRINAVRGAVEEKKDHVERAMRAGREAAQQARNDLERRLAETKAAYNAGAQVARDVKAEKGRQA